MKEMKDYHDLYLKCDFLPLADIFEKFWNNSLINYGLCPIPFFSEPALSWKPMLNMTKVEIELVPDLTCRQSLKKVREVKFLIFLQWNLPKADIL